MTKKGVDHVAAGIEEKKGGEKVPEGEKKDEPTELVGVELVEDGEEEREGEVEGGEGGDGPGREGKGGIHHWARIPHVGHAEGKHPPGIPPL